MRVLLDESLPIDLAAELPGHDVRTVRTQGWSGVLNGELLRRARTEFEVFVTMDRNLPHQQNVSALGVGIVLVLAKSNRLADLRPLIPSMLAAISTVKPGELRRVGA